MAWAPALKIKLPPRERVGIFRGKSLAISSNTRRNDFASRYLITLASEIHNELVHCARFACSNVGSGVCRGCYQAMALVKGAFYERAPGKRQL
jgi:hypothetical protein